jgi:phosphoribosylglycinamide formyltransferase-1
MKRICLFASGSGSNVENIVRYFKEHGGVNITSVVTNNKNAGVIERCERLGIRLIYIDPEELQTKGFIKEVVVGQKVDLIVLAGYLKKIPDDLIEAFPQKIVNIHPALLPKYGGKGMYGMNVHRAVKEAGDKESGISIHFVDEHYDNGDLIEQHRVALSEDDSPEDIAQKVHQLEYEYFPKAIAKLLDV